WFSFWCGHSKLNVEFNDGDLIANYEISINEENPGLCVGVPFEENFNVVINNFYEGIAKFKFDELCDKNLGAEDYLQISNSCNLIFIEELPDFNENNSNQQQRFITLIDIIYEKKIPILISSEKSINNLNSSKSLSKIFKRTISRLHELTSIKI
ncbi:MAG: cell division protein ZapE, partial [Proteobacteria bacterium]|nr:cell division protein ZapE [Pseudomonadota bacterium]